MSNRNKEIGKKHLLRRIFIISSIVTALSVVALIGVTALLPTPSMILSGVALIVATLSASIAVGVGINALQAEISYQKAKKNSINNMNKIAENNKSKTAVYTAQQKKKIVKKIAKSNLKLCKRKGSPVIGRYMSLSDFETAKENEASNIIDNLELLKSIQKNEKGRNKIEAKISKKKSITSTNIRPNAQRWTKNYDDFISGVNILDRRTEIVCLNKDASIKFQELVKNQNVSKDLGGAVVVSIGNSDVKQAYARVADKDLLPKTADILISDVLETCKNGGLEANKMFPVKIFTYSFDKNAKSELISNPQVFSTLAELENAVYNEVER